MRITVQALAAIFGGTQSLHTNSFDEAIALPTEKAARLAVRTQQVLAYETDITNTVDPFAGSYAVEAMTDEIEREIVRLMERIEQLGGAAAAVEIGYQKNAIEETAYDYALQIEKGERIVVGVNKFELPQEEKYEPLKVDLSIEKAQKAKLAKLRETRDKESVAVSLNELKQAAANSENVLYPMKKALFHKATGGEVADALREVWGSYQALK